MILNSTVISISLVLRGKCLRKCNIRMQCIVCYVLQIWMHLLLGALGMHLHHLLGHYLAKKLGKISSCLLVLIKPSSPLRTPAAFFQSSICSLREKSSHLQCIACCQPMQQGVYSVDYTLHHNPNHLGFYASDPKAAHSNLETRHKESRLG